MSVPWMPLYPADFMADTTHLSAAETGAYLMLIMHYWRAGSLPSNEKMLRRISRMGEREWHRSRDVIAAFFYDGWKHKRIENEIAKSESKATARAEYGRRGGEAKALKLKESGVAKATVLPDFCQPPGVAKALASSSQPQPSKETSVSSEKRAGDSAFEMFWVLWPHKVGKPEAMKAFEKVKAEAVDICDGVGAYIRDKPADRPWLNPATFINQRRWEDAPAKLGESNGKRDVHEAFRNSPTGGYDIGPAPKPYVPERDSPPARGNHDRLLPQGGSGGTRDLPSGASLRLVRVPGAGGLPGDGPEDRSGGDIEMASYDFGGSFRV